MPLLGFFGMLGLCRGRQRYQACHTRRGEARTSCRLESVMSTRDRVTVGQDRKRSSRASCSLCWLVVVVTFAMLEDWDFIPAKKNGIEKVLHSATGYSRTHSFIHSFIRLDSALRESRRAVAGTFSRSRDANHRGWRKL